MPTNLETTIDALGALKAQIATLLKQEKALKASLYELPEGTYEGDLFQAAVSKPLRDTLDMDAVREKLSAQFIRAHTTTKEIPTVRVSARNGKAVAA